MTILYTNGCSYTANFDLLADQRYPTLIADRLNLKLKDSSEPGSCNSRIIRTTIQDCLTLLDQHTDIVALVQLSHLHRFEYPSDNNPLPDPFFSIKPTGTNSVASDIKRYAELYWKLHSDQHLLLNLLTSLLGLIGFFRQYNIKYKIFLGPNECELFRQSDIRIDTICKDINVLDLRKFYMLSLTSTPIAHPDQHGMRKIADYFINLLSEPALLSGA